MVVIILIQRLYYSNNLKISMFNRMYFEDTITFVLVILSLYLTCQIILAQISTAYQNFVFVLFLWLLIRLIITFKTINFLLIYFYFEWTLIPIFSIILGWGYQPERIKAGLALFLYTLFASLPLLLSIIFIITYSINIVVSLYRIITINLNNYSESMLRVMIFTAFIVKFPMYLVHLWLPKAHVEAPVSGSIILAGVLLKLGGYGLIRLYFLIIPIWLFKYMSVVTLIGGGILGIYCIVHRDIKLVIAYSSVVHISLVILGFITLCGWGLEGGIIIMFAHGLCSSGIFASANIIYERSHSRRYFLNSGGLTIFPIFSIIWFILIVANFSGPFSLNLLGEIILIINIRQMITLRLLILILLSFFSAAYRLILYRSTQQGQLGKISQKLNLIYFRESIILTNHIWPLVLLTLSSHMFN